MLQAKRQFTKTLIFVPTLNKWVSIGKTPNTTSDGREIPIATQEERKIMCENGFAALFEKPNTTLTTKKDANHVQ